jgi:hypothetical protein
MQRGKGKERVTEVGESSVSAPPPNAPGVPPVQPLPHVQGDDAHVDGPTTDAEAFALAEQDDVEGEGEGEGEGNDEDQTELDLEPDDEVEEHEAEDMDDVDEDVDMNMDADTREIREVLDDEDEMELGTASRGAD